MQTSATTDESVSLSNLMKRVKWMEEFLGVVPFIGRQKGDTVGPNLDQLNVAICQVDKNLDHLKQRVVNGFGGYDFRFSLWEERMTDMRDNHFQVINKRLAELEDKSLIEVFAKQKMLETETDSLLIRVEERLRNMHLKAINARLTAMEDETSNCTSLLNEHSSTIDVINARLSSLETASDEWIDLPRKFKEMKDEYTVMAIYKGDETVQLNKRMNELEKLVSDESTGFKVNQVLLLNARFAKISAEFVLFKKEVGDILLEQVGLLKKHETQFQTLEMNFSSASQ